MVEGENGSSKSASPLHMLAMATKLLCTHTYTCTHAYTHTHIHMCIHIHMHTHIHTHTHTLKILKFESYEFIEIDKNMTSSTSKVKHLLDKMFNF